MRKIFFLHQPHSKHLKNSCRGWHFSLNAKYERVSMFLCTLFEISSSIVAAQLPLWIYCLALKLCGEAHSIQYLFKYPIKGSQNASDPVSREALKWGQLSLPTVGVLLVQVQTHKDGGMWRSTILLNNGSCDALEVLDGHSTEDAVCRSLLSHFRFWRSYAQLLLFSFRAQSVCCLAIEKLHLEVPDPYLTVYLVDKSR